jgi:hypothetical protein
VPPRTVLEERADDLRSEARAGIRKEGMDDMEDCSKEEQAFQRESMQPRSVVVGWAELVQVRSWAVSSNPRDLLSRPVAEKA